MTNKELLKLEEVKDYIKAKNRLAYVSTGGAGNANCSFMDICSRAEIEEAARKEAYTAIGKIILPKLINLSQVSDCCNEPIIDESIDVCSKCKEHCTIIKD